MLSVAAINSKVDRVTEKVYRFKKIENVSEALRKISDLDQRPYYGTGFSAIGIEILSKPDDYRALGIIVNGARIDLEENRVYFITFRNSDSEAPTKRLCGLLEDLLEPPLT